jgi:hypothetical protein
MSTATPESVLDLIETYFDRGLTDGLPVIPPTEEAVARAVEMTGGSGEQVVAPQPPFGQGPILLRDLAACAVMAGCKPEYMPVVATAARLLFREPPRWIATTKGVAQCVVVNGPVRDSIELNGGFNAFSPGFRANATIGRSIRLAVLNLCGGRSGLYDRSTLGSAYKYSWVVAEQEEDSPWEPLHVEKGIPATSDAVTVAVCSQPHEVSHLDARTPEAILGAIADQVVTVSTFNTAYRPGAEGSVFEPKPASVMVFLGGDHRLHLRRAGWSKRDAKTYLAEHAHRRIGDFRRWGSRGLALVAADASDEDMAHVLGSADNVDIVAVGGPGAHSAVAFCRWSSTDAVTPWT